MSSLVLVWVFFFKNSWSSVQNRTVRAVLDQLLSFGLVPIGISVFN